MVVNSDEKQSTINEVYEWLADTSIYASVDELKERIEAALDMLENVYSGEK